MTTIEEIQSLLPSVYRDAAQEGSPLAAIIATMATLANPVEETWGSLDEILDPRRTPDAFVPYLASWLALDRLFPKYQLNRQANSSVNPEISTGVGRLRELVASAAELSRLRGSKLGLIRFLETATGETRFVVDDEIRLESGKLKPFFFRIFAPSTLLPHRRLLRTIVDSEKPAYVTYELIFSEPDTNK